MEAPTYPDVIDLLISWLRPKLEELESAEGSGGEIYQGVTIGAKVPETRQGNSPLVVVRRIGGEALPPIRDVARVDLLHWNATLYKATKLANATRGMVYHELPNSVIDGHTVYRVREFAGPLPYPDPAGSAVPIIMYTAEVAVRVK